MGDFSKRFYSIKNDREFRYIYRKGESIGSYGFICYWLPNNRRRNRCGIVTGKKIGCAVKRNRSRRVIREAFRLFDHELTAETEKRFDLVFVARDTTAAMSSDRVLDTMRLKLKPRMLGKDIEFPAKPRKKTGKSQDRINEIRRGDGNK